MTPHGTPRFSLSLVREAESDYADMKPLDNPASAAAAFEAIFSLSAAPAERMVAIYTDARHRAIGAALLFQGTLNRAAAEPRQILAAGLLLNAAGFVLAHNHPSGDPTPSAEDVAFTRRLAVAADTVGVRLVDHLTIGENGRWASLRRNGVFA